MNLRKTSKGLQEETLADYHVRPLLLWAGLFPLKGEPSKDSENLWAWRGKISRGPFFDPSEKVFRVRTVYSTRTSPSTTRPTVSKVKAQRRQDRTGPDDLNRQQGTTSCRTLGTRRVPGTVVPLIPSKRWHIKIRRPVKNTIVIQIRLTLMSGLVRLWLPEVLKNLYKVKVKRLQEVVGVVKSKRRKKNRPRRQGSTASWVAETSHLRLRRLAARVPTRVQESTDGNKNQVHWVLSF